MDKTENNTTIINDEKKVPYENVFWLFMLGNVIGVILEGCWTYFIHGHWETHVVTIWGPFCLIYGIGIAGLYILSKKLHGKNVVVKFLAIAVVLDAFEYFCAWLIDSQLGMKAWDYSNCLMNVKGRISLSMTLLWGIGGVLFCYFCEPAVDRMLKKMQGKGWKVACVVLTMFMVINMAATSACLVRWSKRHNGVKPATKIEMRIDNKYNDDFMQQRFIEWSFIK